MSTTKILILLIKFKCKFQSAKIFIGSPRSKRGTQTVLSRIPSLISPQCIPWCQLPTIWCVNPKIPKIDAGPGSPGPSPGPASPCPRAPQFLNVWIRPDSDAESNWWSGNKSLNESIQICLNLTPMLCSDGIGTFHQIILEMFWCLVSKPHCCNVAYYQRSAYKNMPKIGRSTGCSKNGA